MWSNTSCPRVTIPRKKKSEEPCGCTARGKRNLQRRTYVLTRFHSRGPRSPTPLAIAAFHRCKSTQRLPPRTTSSEGRGGQESKRETPPRQRDTAEVCNVAIFLSNRHRAILRLNIHGHDWELNKRKVVVYPIPTFPAMEASTVNRRILLPAIEFKKWKF